MKKKTFTPKYLLIFYIGFPSTALAHIVSMLVLFFTTPNNEYSLLIVPLIIWGVLFIIAGILLFFWIQQMLGRYPKSMENMLNNAQSESGDTSISVARRVGRRSSPKTLDDVYSKELMPLLQKLEALRKVALHLTLLLIPIIILGAGVHAYLYHMNYMTACILYTIVFILGILIFEFSYYSNRVGDYLDVFKNQVIPKIITFFSEGDSTVNYEPLESISRTAFHDSDFLPMDYHEFYGEDLMKGSWKGHAFKMSEITVVIQKGSHRNKRSKTIFNGIFGSIDTNINWVGRTMIIPTNERLIQRMNKLKYSYNRKKILEMDPSLDALAAQYSIRCTHEDAIRALDLKTLNKVVYSIQNAFHCPITIGISQNKIHFGMVFAQDIFEPALFSSILDKKNIVPHYLYFRSLMEVIAQVVTVVRSEEE